MPRVKKVRKDAYMLKGALAKKGYDWWWHSFTAVDVETKEEKAFFIEYFIINPALSPDSAVLGQLHENKVLGVKPSYVMVKAGCWGDNARQINNFYPVKEMKKARRKLEITVGGCFLSENEISGRAYLSEEDRLKHPEYMSDAGEIVWNLKVDKQIPYDVGYGASNVFRTLNAFEMYWHVEGMKTLYEGTVFLDGREYEVSKETSFGYADKNWGQDFTSPWIWLSSCNLKSRISGRELKNSVFCCGGGRPKAFGVPLDKRLLIDLCYEGKHFEFNFSKFWTGAKTKFNISETGGAVIWKIVAENDGSVMKIYSTCQKKDMLLINYEAPNGKKLHNRLFNGGNGVGKIGLYKKEKDKQTLVDIIEFENAGCEYGEYDK